MQPNGSLTPSGVCENWARGGKRLSKKVDNNKRSALNSALRRCFSVGYL